MTTHFTARLKYFLFSTALAAIVCISTLAFLSGSLDDLRSVDRALLIEEGSKSEVLLPRFWRAPTGNVTSTKFELQFDTNDYALSFSDTYFFLPFFEQRAFLSINGTAIESPELEKPRYSPLAYSYALQKIPASALRSGINTIEIRVETGPGRFGALPNIYIGALDTLQSPFSLFSFATFELRILLLGAEILLAFFSILTFLHRRSDVIYGWLSAALLGSIFSSISIFSNLFPALEIFTLSSYLLLPTAGFSILGFALTFSSIPITRWLFGAIFSVPALAIILNLGFSFSPDTVLVYLTMPALILSLVISGILIMVTSVRDDSNQTNILFVSLIVLAMAVTYDTGVRLGVFSTGIPVSVFARFLVLFGVITYLMRRATANAEALDQSSRILQEKLEAREKTLREVFSAQQATLEKFAKSEERQRITAELHDGVAGHLITILALVDSDSEQKEPIRKTTRIALEELRTVIDMLVVSNTNLEFTLANFRERCLEPIEKSGVGITFNVESLSAEVNLSPIEALNIFRILQEATTNAVRHGHPKEIHVKGWSEGATIFLSVENRGGEALKDYSAGFGLRNMSKRARSVRGGEVDLSGTDSGAILSVQFLANAQP